VLLLYPSKCIALFFPSPRSSVDACLSAIGRRTTCNFHRKLHHRRHRLLAMCKCKVPLSSTAAASFHSSASGLVVRLLFATSIALAWTWTFVHYYKQHTRAPLIISAVQLRTHEAQQITGNNGIHLGWLLYFASES
jgi:hypothetical protein